MVRLFSCQENNINASLAIAPYEDNLIIMKNNLGSENIYQIGIKINGMKEILEL